LTYRRFLAIASLVEFTSSHTVRVAEMFIWRLIAQMVFGRLVEYRDEFSLGGLVWWQTHSDTETVCRHCLQIWLQKRSTCENFA